MAYRVRNLTRQTTVGREITEAKTFLQRLLGLLNRASLPEGHGILFRHCRSVHTIGMRFSIEVLALDCLDRVHTACNLRPNRLSWFPKEVSSILELGPGTTQKSQTKVGDALSFEETPCSTTRLPET